MNGLLLRRPVDRGVTNLTQPSREILSYRTPGARPKDQKLTKKPSAPPARNGKPSMVKRSASRIPSCTWTQGLARPRRPRSRQEQAQNWTPPFAPVCTRVGRKAPRPPRSHTARATWVSQVEGIASGGYRKWRESRGDGGVEAAASTSGSAKRAQTNPDPPTLNIRERKESTN